MSKLNTGKIKELIVQWVSAPEVLDKVGVIFYSPSQLKNMTDEDSKNLSQAKKDFLNWKRDSKARIKNSNWIEECEDLEEELLLNGCAHGINKEVLAKHKDNTAECWERTFFPVNDRLADTFRMHVITTPDDTEVIGWVIIDD